MLDSVKKRVGAIGYVSYSYAKRHGMQVAAIKNGHSYVAPCVTTIGNAVCFWLLLTELPVLITNFTGFCSVIHIACLSNSKLARSNNQQQAWRKRLPNFVDTLCCCL